MSDRIAIFDTSLRDGEQSPGCSMTPDEKVRFARQLERLGVDVIEAGFPVASKAEFEAVRRVATEVRGCGIAALARGRPARSITTHSSFTRSTRCSKSRMGQTSKTPGPRSSRQ